MEEHWKTRKAWDVPRHAHALTFSVRHRQPWLALPGASDAFLKALDAARGDLSFELWAYVVMPEHAHIVLDPLTETYRMADVLTSIKRPAAKAIFHLHPELREACRVVRKGRRDEFHFWQDGGGYDRNLLTSREAWEKIQYAHDNPTKRGLVEDPVDYRWSSLRAYRELEPPIPVDLCPWGSP